MSRSSKEMIPDELPFAVESEKTVYGVLFADDHVVWAEADGTLSHYDIRTVYGQEAFRNEHERNLKRMHVTKIEPISFVKQTIYQAKSDIEEFVPLA